MLLRQQVVSASTTTAFHYPGSPKKTMSFPAIILYEGLYAVIYFGLLFSKRTLLDYYPDPSAAARIIFLFVLWSGFFLPAIPRLLRIQLRKKHYWGMLFLLSILYIGASISYYARQMDDRRFRGYHPYLQVKPAELNAAIPKPPDVYRIICMGGSTTEGRGDGGYPAVLGQLLQKKFPDKKIEVLNAGCFFYTTQHCIIYYLTYIQELEPDLLIMFEAQNDLIASCTMPIFASSPFRRDYGHFYGALAQLRYPESFEKFLSAFFYADLLAPALTPTAFTDFKSQHSFRRNLETFIKNSRGNGVALILANQAHCFSTADGADTTEKHTNILRFMLALPVDEKHYADEQSWHAGMELFNRIAQQTADKFNVPFVDQAAVFKNKQQLFRDEVHLVPEGTALLARLFFNEIVQRKFLEKQANR
jgi:lysophospholipase L1-like esterase